MTNPLSAARWLFDGDDGPRDRLIPRWLFLRALGGIYFSAFFSLAFQIRGLIGPQGILPAQEYLQAVAHSFGHFSGLWFAPGVLWISSNSPTLMALCWIGMLASVLLALNFWPRGSLAVCFICFLSFVSAAQDFSGYQSDGMLLEAGFISLFLAPRGLRPRLGASTPPVRAGSFLLQWEWFRIYFESGVAKIRSGDPQWRNFTAMDEYYQNGPLPTWVGWYIQHLPHWFHASTAIGTLALELILVWTLFMPRRWRIVCFCIVTPWELGVILTANYAFLNYLVLVLGILLLDDKFCARLLPQSWKRAHDPDIKVIVDNSRPFLVNLRQRSKTAQVALTSFVLLWICYATTVQMLWMFGPLRLPTTPVILLDPFRIANRYGLFAVMTRGRYEIEFQGSDDGKIWTPYPFRHKPQDLGTPPGIYAPYQPRFDWNLWFASLGSWEDYSIVPRTEERLLAGDRDVIALFAKNPFPDHPPKQVRAVLWQYWFTTLDEKRWQHLWWRRELLGLYAPTVELAPDGNFRGVEWPNLRERE